MRTLRSPSWERTLAWTTLRLGQMSVMSTSSWSITILASESLVLVVTSIMTVVVSSDIRELSLLVTGGKEMTVLLSVRQGNTGQLSSRCRYWCRPVTLLLFFSFLSASASVLMRLIDFLLLNLHYSLELTDKLVCSGRLGGHQRSYGELGWWLGSKEQRTCTMNNLLQSFWRKVKPLSLCLSCVAMVARVLFLQIPL